MKKPISLLLAGLFSLAVLASCGSTASSTSASSASLPSSGASTPAPAASGPALRIAGLKGPTTMGMVKLMEDAASGEQTANYQVEMFGTPDEIVPKLISGDIDMAAIPANLASILYNRNQGDISVAAINTLGVLYIVETGNTIQSVADLKGKTLYSTGQGTTPEFVLNYILSQNGLVPGQDVTIEYKSEATEVAALLKNNPDAIALLPQPYVTAVQMQNENLRIALDLTQEWNNISPDSSLVTGVLVVRNTFAQQNPAAVAAFLQDYQASIEWVNSNPGEAAQLIAQFGIVEKPQIAEKALPYCNIVFINGPEMEHKLSGYLQVLYDQNPESVGGTLPGEGFYFQPAAAEPA